MSFKIKKVTLFTKRLIKLRKSGNACERCNNATITHIRHFDYNLLPVEYFHKPRRIILYILRIRGISEGDAYPQYWIDLPRKLKSSMRIYKICDECYEIAKKMPI